MDEQGQLQQFRVVWPDGFEVEVEATKVKSARWKAVIDRTRRGDGYVTSDEERRRLDVNAVHDTEHDVCEVRQAPDGGWWIVTKFEEGKPTTLPCPHCAKPVQINENGSAPGRPMVLWEFQDRDTAEGLAQMVNVMILSAVMHAVVAEDAEAA